eukprot:1190873-Prorocentrum_minimum.AAC.4
MGSWSPSSAALSAPSLLPQCSKCSGIKFKGSNSPDHGVLEPLLRGPQRPLLAAAVLQIYRKPGPPLPALARGRSSRQQPPTRGEIHTIQR